MINIEIWASGGGTNAHAIMKYFSNHPTIRICSLGCNRIDAGSFVVAKKHNIPSIYWNKDNWRYEEILKQLKARKIDLVILAGFLKLVPSAVTKEYEGKGINIHPSLLPKYGGQNMYGDYVHNAVLANKEDLTGITMHEVNEEFDKGKVLAQFATSLNPNYETLSSIKQKIQKLEHANFAPIIEAWAKSKVA